MSNTRKLSRSGNSKQSKQSDTQYYYDREFHNEKLIRVEKEDLESITHQGNSHFITKKVRRGHTTGVIIQVFTETTVKKRHFLYEDGTYVARDDIKDGKVHPA